MKRDLLRTLFVSVIVMYIIVLGMLMILIIGVSYLANRPVFSCPEPIQPTPILPRTKYVFQAGGCYVECIVETESGDWIVIKEYLEIAE